MADTADAMAAAAAVGSEAALRGGREERGGGVGAEWRG
jgi:hypothetical protein